MASKKRKKKTTTARSASPASRLDAYRRKRDFDRTAEPAGGDVAASSTGRLFVVQKHAARNLHYDLRLELDGVLKSWAVPRGPSLDPAQKPLAVLVEDHPVEYGVFEGIIPKGEYGGGTVMLWDRGAWEPIGDPAEGLAAGDLKFRLHGEKLRGEWVLARMSGAGNESGKNWLLIKKRDDEARPVAAYNVLAEMPYSVATGRPLDEITRAPEAVWSAGGAQSTGTVSDAGVAPPSVPDPANLPNARPGKPPPRLAPQLARAADSALEGDAWLHEIKLDGYRLLCHVDDDGTVRLLTRNGHDWTDRMPTVARAAGRLPVRDAVIDGELVVLDANGISSFQTLQNAFRGGGGGEGGPFSFFAFDVPFAGGVDLRRAPLIERKRYLRALIEAAPSAGPVIQYCDHIVGKGPIVYQQAHEAGLEGIVSKRRDSQYESRRTDTWRKVKCRLAEAFLVGGFTPPAGSRAGLGALLIGQHDDDGHLVYRGRVGSGFTDQQLDDLAAHFATRSRSDAPFANPEADPDHRTVHWVEPELIVQVEMTGWTDEGLARHAVFRGVRTDKTPDEIVHHASRERAASPESPTAQRVVRSPRSPKDATVAGVRISHPDRTVYPEARITKRDVAEYYAQIADWILPHLIDRPLSLVRCPLGLAGESFYQRQRGEGFPDAIDSVTIEEDGEPTEAIVIRDLDGLLGLVQMGVLEIHPWGARTDNLERPDRMTLDLDPGPGITWGDVVGAAHFIHEYLKRLGLESFVKTSGGSGLHVVVPLVRRAGWDDVKSFAHDVATDLTRLAPRNFVATMSKTHRKYRIYVDYLRNLRGSTVVGAYSTRARPGAHVSTPLAWDELSAELTPDRLTVRTLPERLASIDTDPWAKIAEVRQSITAAMRRTVRGE